MITSFGMALRKKDDAELDMQCLSMFLNLLQTNSVLQTVSTGQSVAMAMLNLCYSTYGDVFDYGSILADTRSADDIMGDIKTAQASIDSLSEQIADILTSIEKKGR